MNNVIILVVSASCLCSAASAGGEQLGWYRGNTHVHTINSDGDSAPDSVVRWYREHHYNFVVVTDHNIVTPVDALNGLLGALGSFLVVSGEEVTTHSGNVPTHLTAFNVRTTLTPVSGSSVVDTFNQNAAAIREAGGEPIINHPNGGQTIGFPGVRDVVNASLFEICCADRHGGGDAPSTDEIWDAALSSGRKVYAVAADDADVFHGDTVQAGGAYIMVRATALTPSALQKALASGDSYATTGVELIEYTLGPSAVSLKLDGTGGKRYRTYFIGQHGVSLRRDDSLAPAYQLNGSESYVRARVERADGATAWIQPFFPEHEAVPAKEPSGNGLNRRYCQP